MLRAFRQSPAISPSASGWKKPCRKAKNDSNSWQNAKYHLDDGMNLQYTYMSPYVKHALGYTPRILNNIAK